MQDRTLTFLLQAKKSTYAAGGSETNPSRPNSHDLRYDEGEYTYIDTYLGSKCFTGEEAIWSRNMPLWAMNYSGRVLDDRFDGDFLKRALLQVPPERPFRGPETYQEGSMRYVCNVNGDDHWFHGYEEILLGDERIYECFFHGGVVE